MNWASPVSQSLKTFTLKVGENLSNTEYHLCNLQTCKGIKTYLWSWKLYRKDESFHLPLVTVCSCFLVCTLAVALFTLKHNKNCMNLKPVALRCPMAILLVLGSWTIWSYMHGKKVWFYFISSHLNFSSLNKTIMKMIPGCFSIVAVSKCDKSETLWVKV